MTSIRVLAFLILILSSCIKTELAPIPTFVSFQQVDFKAAPDQGSDHQLISEIWIYADSQLIGAYPLPSLVPVLGDGTIKLDMYAGIRENAQAASPIVYPLISPWSATITVQPESTIEIMPVFTYAKEVRFPLVEDFENSNLFREDLDGDTLTRFDIIADGGIEAKSARAILSLKQPLLEVASNFPFNLPSNGVPVFLELEYAAETNLAVGLKVGPDNKLYKLLLFANNLEPQKIYVNFTAEIEAAKGQDFQIIFLSTYDDTAGKSEQLVIIDNIKLLHFRS